MWRKEQQRIEFFNSEPSIIENFPIIESKDLKLNWVKALKKDFQDRVENTTTTDKPSFTHLSRCPGIFDLFKYGYIIPLHKDLTIKPKGNKNFEWILPSAPQDDTFKIDWISSDHVAKPPWTADFIVKICTGWNIIAPKDLKILVLPITYPDTFDFTAAAGILNPAMATHINFQMFWNYPDKETTIPAGTPLGHLIPLTEKKYKWTQRISNQQDRDWIKMGDSTRSTSFRPHTMRSKMVAMYKKYWNR
jgi:hypothetical protein